MRQRIALRVQNFIREILCFGNNQGIGRAANGLPHLLNNGNQARPHDLQPDGIGLNARHGGLQRHAWRYQGV